MPDTPDTDELARQSVVGDSVFDTVAADAMPGEATAPEGAAAAMSEEEQSHFFYEIFDASLPRLGPGDDESTAAALRMVLAAMGASAEQPDRLRILDIGCGSGDQTLLLARLTGAHIVAVDNYPAFLDELVRRAGVAGVEHLIEPRLQDMNELAPPAAADGLFDLVWAEGSLFVVGFAAGLRLCGELLVPGGLLVASELTWLRLDPPAECREYFAAAYPAMTDTAGNLALAATCGYEVVGHFTIPESSWWTNYYHPLEARLTELRAAHAADAARMGMLDWVQEEIEMYRRFSSYYGNEFYLLRRVDGGTHAAG